MRAVLVHFIGFVLLLGSTLPQDIVAHAEAKANEAIPQLAIVRPKKRDPNVTRKAIKAVKRRTSAKQIIKFPSPSVGLLPVVNQEDIRVHHRKMADDVLRSLPAACTDHLENFYVRYDNPERRGLAGKKSIILDGTVPDDEFVALLIHEFGHITDLGCMAGSKEIAPSGYKDGSEIIYANDPSVSFYSISWKDAKTQTTNSSPEDFVSGYAGWDAFEDFAETYVYYALQNESFRTRARKNPVLAAKYRWMSRNAFANTTKIAEGNFVWEGRIPWDTTKLSYKWLEADELALK